MALLIVPGAFNRRWQQKPPSHDAGSFRVTCGDTLPDILRAPGKKGSR
jgi:hypothetical protein